MAVYVPLDLFRNPTVIEYTAADSNFHQVTGLPPNANELGKYALALINAAKTAAGNLAYLAWNKTSAPSVGFPLFGSGQVQVYGGGLENLWVKLVTSTDILYIVVES